MIEEIDRFADAQLQPTSRSEAIRLLVEFGLDSLSRAAPPTPERKKR